MPRNLNATEKQQAKQIWPNMNVDTVLVTGEATEQYNCLAWTLGITTSWVWPWGSRNATKPEFDALYRTYNFQPAGSGTIAAFGLNLTNMTHGAVFSFPFNKWESKCGKWLRITHSLPEMEGGTAYGNVQGYYAKRTALRQMIETMAADFNTNHALSKDEGDALAKKIATIAPAIQAEFSQRYERWKKTWEHPLIMISSVPGDRAKSIEFLELISMGSVIVPLLVDKLREPSEFFALVALDRLLDERLLITRDIEDEAVLLGEQGRALETVKRWVQANL